MQEDTWKSRAMIDEQLKFAAAISEYKLIRETPIRLLGRKKARPKRCADGVEARVSAPRGGVAERGYLGVHEHARA